MTTGLTRTKMSIRSSLTYLAGASRAYNLETFLASSLLGLPQGLQKSLMPKRVKLPDGVKVFLNDLATIHINIPDQYLRKEYEAMPDYVPKSGWVVVDVGAYVGLYSLHAARIVGNGGFVAAFEPNPVAYYWLLRNINLNKSGNVSAFNEALGDTETVSDFYVVTRGNTEASSLVGQHMKSSTSEVESYVKTRIPVTTLDDVYHESIVFDDKPINLAKIDVEGFELNVLRGSKKLLDDGLIERLVIEVHINVVQSDAVEMFLDNFGYRLERRVKLNHIKEIHYYRRKTKTR